MRETWTVSSKADVSRSEQMYFWTLLLVVCVYNVYPIVLFVFISASHDNAKECNAMEHCLKSGKLN